MKPLMEKNALNRRERRRLAYIMGPNYSGSTLLTLLLAGHSQVATVGELKATSMGDIATYLCSCGEALPACPFWRQVIEVMHQQGRCFNLNHFGTHFRAPHDPFTDRLLRATLRGPVFEMARGMAFFLSPHARTTRQEIVDQNRALIEVICTLQQAELFLDDSKEPIRLKYLLAADCWDIHVIHLIRDGRGVTNSYMRHNKAAMAKAVKEWMHTQRECDRMARILGNSRCLPLHYEELCRQPRENLAQIYRFLELDADVQSSGDRVKHIMGNQMRLGSLQDIRLDEKWKQALSTENLRLFTTTAGALNRFHGYN